MTEENKEFENDDELDELKNYYKKDNSKEQSSGSGFSFFKKNTNKTDNNLYSEKNIFLRSKKILSYLAVFFSFLIFLFLIIFIADKWIIPSMVHDRPVVKVPDITGLQLKEANKVLDESKLFYEIIGEQFSNEPEGQIIKQIPIEGEQVKSKRPIFITVSKGKEKIKVPEVIGSPLRDARVEIYNSGLNIGNIEYTYNDVVPKENIISQSIRAGRDIIYGDTVNLIVSKGPEYQVYVPNVVNLPYDGIEEYLKSQGFNLGSVEFLESDTFIPGTIISQLPPPDELSSKGEYINIVVAK